MHSLIDELRSITKVSRGAQQMSVIDSTYKAWRSKFLTPEFFNALKTQAEMGSYNMVVKCEEEDILCLARWCYDHGFQWNDEVRVISWAISESERHEMLIANKFAKPQTTVA